VLVACIVLMLPSQLLAQERPRPAGLEPVRPELGRPGQGPAVVVEGEILVKFRPGASGQEIGTAHRRLGGTEVAPAGPAGATGARVVRVERGRERERAVDYRSDPAVEYAEPNGKYFAPRRAPKDRLLGQQWQYENTGQSGGAPDADIDATEAWQIERGGPAVPIAILDSGVDVSHEDLRTKVARRVNFSPAPTADDKLGHGTHVAGIAAAVTNNRAGVAGTCPRCVLFNVKVLGDDGAGDWAAIARGIIWAADNGARVINMSFGAYAESLTVGAAVDYAWVRGVVLTAAAGNDGENWGFYPGAFPRVIAVAATDARDVRAAWSNWGGNWVALAAPGVDILSTATDRPSAYWPSAPKYGWLSGTSMAAPHVAGVAGLVWSTRLCPRGDSFCVRSRLEATADPIGDPARDPTHQWHYGRLNACRAVGGICPTKTD